MVTGPEVATILSDFEPSFANKKADLHGLHHDEGVSTQLKFKTDVLNLTSYWSDRCNRFNEDNRHLIKFHMLGRKGPSFQVNFSKLTGLFRKEIKVDSVIILEVLK